MGQGVHTGRSVMQTIFPDKDANGQRKSGGSIFSLRRPRRRSSKASEHSVPINGLIPGMAVHLAKCCYPLPGDRIVGIMMPGRGINIHTIDCDSLLEFQETADEWLDLAWEADNNADDHVARIDLTVRNEPGTLGDMAASVINAKLDEKQDVLEIAAVAFVPGGQNSF